MKLLSIGTDRKIFENGSDVAIRQIEYAKNQNLDEMHIVVFSLKKLEFYNKKISENIWVYPTNSKIRLGYIWDAYRIGKRLISTGASLLYESSGTQRMNEGFSQDKWIITCQDSFETGKTGWMLKRKFGVKLELQVHTDVFSPYFHTYKLGLKLCILNWIRQRMARFLLPRADKIRVVSDRIKKSLIDELSIDTQKIEVRPISLKINTDQNNQILTDTFDTKRVRVLMVSRLEPEKNVGMAIKVWARVVSNHPEAKLTIVGSGSQEKKLKKLVKKLDIESNVKFEGWKKPNELQEYYKSAKLFINTSFYEGYGLTLKEAEAAGCPIVTTDVGIARELKNVIIFDVKNNEELKKAILVLLSKNP